VRCALAALQDIAQEFVRIADDPRRPLPRRLHAYPGRTTGRDD